jgi:hypothetical protein
MEIKIDIQELRKRKLFVAAPMYGGQCAGMFCRSTNDLAAAAVHHGIELRYYYLFNESLITRARNYCVDEFMRSDCTHMLFIDSDIGFNAQDIIVMLALMSDESEYDILCGPYPKKCISWEKVKAAVDKGVADEDPNVLEKYVGDYVFNPAGGRTEIPLGEPVEVLESGTGFMMIRKSALQKYADKYPELSYRPDHVRTAAFDGSREILAYFDALIDNKYMYMRDEIREFFEKNPNATSEEVIAFIDDPKVSANGNQFTGRYLSEDYMFCQMARRAGLKVWLCPWIQLQHVGSYIFGGSLADLAAVGASATVDPSKLGKKK